MSEELCVLCEAAIEKFDAHGIMFHRAKRSGEWVECPQTSPKIAALKDGERILREDINMQAGTIQELRTQLTDALRQRDEAMCERNEAIMKRGQAMNETEWAMARVKAVESERDNVVAQLAACKAALEVSQSYVEEIADRDCPRADEAGDDLAMVRQALSSIGSGAGISTLKSERDNVVAQVAVCKAALQGFINWQDRPIGTNPETQLSYLMLTQQIIPAMRQALASIGPQAERLLKIEKAAKELASIHNSHAESWAYCYICAVKEALLTAATNPSRDDAEARVLAMRGSYDAPGFDACVKAERAEATRVCIVTDAICWRRCTDRCLLVSNGKPGEWS